MHPVERGEWNLTHPRHNRVIRVIAIFESTRPVTRKNAEKSLTLLIVDGISPNFAGELGLCCILEIPLEIAVLLTVGL